MAEQIQSLEKAKKILDYWYAIEFLAQDKFDDMWEIRSKFLKAQDDFAKGKFKGKTIGSYRELQASQSIYDIISSDAISCGLKKWGNITIYIGKIKREACIECIARSLPGTWEEERPEKTQDSIALASLQLAPDGTYVEHSFSLSTIIWSMNQIKSGQGSLAESIDEKEYRIVAEEIEKKFFGKEEGRKQVSEGKDSQKQEVKESEECIQKFSQEAVTVKLLKDIYKYIKKAFVDGNIESTDSTDAGQDIQEVYGISFQLFADEKSRTKMDEDNYLGLSHDFFSGDIKFVLQKIKDETILSEGHMGDDLVHYISALDETDQKEKIDLVSPKDRDSFFQQVSEILRVENAPLGKWPSKFMPAFMQQMAVNLCIRKGTSDLYGVNGRVFSVNGPPGTGKTTLLKEIVVSNIIERAVLLAEYKDPDDAFEKQAFLHGEKQEHAYSTYIRGWYRLKKDKINDYSVLVTSCNNAAVENVSKELPLGTSLLNDLKPAADDAEEYRRMLDEVSCLFDSKRAQTYETISKKSVQDIYFTEYAKGLFDNEGVWGLVAAPLGRKINISSFYNNVLNPLIWDFYAGRDFKDIRIEKYAQAREDFNKQLKVVQGLQEQLKDICAAVSEWSELLIMQKKSEQGLAERKAEYESLLEAEKLPVKKLKKDLDQTISKLQDIQKKKEKAELLILEAEQEKEALSIGKRELLEKEADARRGTGVLGRLFNKKRAETKEQVADGYHEDVLKAEAELGRVERLLEERMQILQEVQTEVDKAVQTRNQIEESITAKLAGMHEMEEQIQKAESGLQQIRTELSNKKPMYLEKIKSFTQDASVDAGTLLDTAFIDQLLSGDIKESTDAQVANPWFTKRYNIEREKLFYYAMRLNKEFVLSSKSCRDNFKTLGQYWGMLPGDEKERVIFHKEDRELFAGALYQTLFLLVPVLSSTFASLGKFLSDAKQAGVIGTLIVDEAGQAQPQMAVGALYRSRKAMIVGDPKQVEPVVTDDLNLLKRAFEDEALMPYKSKTVSVQSFADRLNSFGTWLDNGTDYPEWVGCPLLVHRRCISPMYDISNEISYNGIMKQQTREPDAKKESSFVYEKSQWINVTGKEKGNKNHFVEAQAQKVCEILEKAFSKSENPNLYIISPFTSVVDGMKAYIKAYKKNTVGTSLSRCESEWLGRNIGTVHTFQGKEANEVIFLLGCDTSPKSQGAVKWVNSNIVNVAVTRAKYRLYVIGDEKAWQASSCVKKAKTILDTFAIRKIKTILEGQLSEEEQAKALLSASVSLPSITSFQVNAVEDEDGSIDFSVDTSSLLQGLDPGFMSEELTKEQLGKFGFKSIEDLKELPLEVQDNLLLGMKLFYLLSPVYKVNSQLDASCCAILFCKALELRMKECFEESLKSVFPEEKIRGQGKGRGSVELQNVKSNELTLGAFQTILYAKRAELGRRMAQKGKEEYGYEWWDAFVTRLRACTDRRNRCCHSGLFSWKEQSYLLAEMFKRNRGDSQVQMEGILFESKIGKRLR